MDKTKWANVFAKHGTLNFHGETTIADGASGIFFLDGYPSGFDVEISSGSYQLYTSCGTAESIEADTAHFEAAQSTNITESRQFAINEGVSGVKITSVSGALTVAWRIRRYE